MTIEARDLLNDWSRQFGETRMKTIGAALVVLGFVLWFGGELVNLIPYNIAGIPVLGIGAVLYFVGRRR